MTAPPSKQRRDRGATIPIVALVLPVLILATAFAVDLGRQRSLRRDLQADADVIALDLSWEIDEGNAPDNATTLAVLNRSLERNQMEPVSSFDGSEGVTVEWGRWTPPQPGQECPRTIVTAPPSCFVANTPIVDSVRVTLEDELDYFFQPGTGRAVRSAIATVGAAAVGEFSIGSFGASLDPTNQGLLNSLLTPLLGHPVGLDLLGYQGLAGANISIFDLGAELGLLTPDEVLNTDVPIADMMLAAANVLERGGGDTATVNLLRNMFGEGITAEIGQLDPIRLGDMVGVSPGAEESALGADVNLLDMITAAAFLSQCTNPEDLSTCSALNVPDLGITLPLVEADAALRIVQGQVRARGPVGTSARTNQTQLDLDLTLGAQEVGVCQPSLANLFCLLNGLLVGTVDAAVSLEASVRLAAGRGTIAEIRCGDPLGLDVATRTGLYELDIRVTVQFGRRGLLGGVLGPLLGSLVLVGSTDATDAQDLAVFNIPTDVFGQTVRETGNGNIGLAPIALTPQGGTGVLGVLNNLGIGLTVGSVLNTLVNPLLNTLDTAVLGPLTDLLGLNVVGADVTPHDVECDMSGRKLVG